jgi:hypothetical protein
LSFLSGSDGADGAADPGALGAVLGEEPGDDVRFGTAGAAGTAGIPQGFVFWPPSGGELGSFGYWLGGLDVVVSDFRATALEALGGGVEGDPEPGCGGADGVAAGAAAGGRETLAPGATEVPVAAAGLGAEERPVAG